MESGARRDVRSNTSNGGKNDEGVWPLVVRQHGCRNMFYQVFDSFIHAVRVTSIWLLWNSCVRWRVAGQTYQNKLRTGVLFNTTCDCSTLLMQQGLWTSMTPQFVGPATGDSFSLLWIAFRADVTYTLVMHLASNRLAPLSRYLAGVLYKCSVTWHYIIMVLKK